MKRIFKKKCINDVLNLSTSSQDLKRSIGPLGLTVMGVGAIIGAGIFIVTGVASAKSGPGLVLSFIIAAIACTFTAFCYAEFASMIPVAGSVYTYAYVAMGEIWAWMIGWILMFEYLIASSSVAIGWSAYTVGLLNSLGIVLPAMLTNPLGVNGGLLNLPALLIVVFLTEILLRGAEESARFNAIAVGIKIAIIVIFIAVGLSFINPMNYHPFMPYGWSGIFQGASMVFFAYIGFDAVASAAEEAKDPQRTLPIGILGSLIISSILYIAVAAVMTGMVNYTFLNNAAPVSAALQHVGVGWALSIVTLGAIAGLTTVILVNLFGQTRIAFAMSRDGLLPDFFSKVHAKSKAPSGSILIIGIFASIISAFLPMESIFELVNIGALSAFIFLALSIIILRKNSPDICRSFKCPLVPVIPVISIGMSLLLISKLSTSTIRTFIIWIMVGIVFYFVYGKHTGRFKSQEDSEKSLNEINPVEPNKTGK